MPAPKKPMRGGIIDSLASSAPVLPVQNTVTLSRYYRSLDLMLMQVRLQHAPTVQQGVAKFNPLPPCVCLCRYPCTGMHRTMSSCMSCCCATPGEQCARVHTSTWASQPPDNYTNQ